MSWTSEQIRTQFLAFFEAKKHQKVPSAPMVVKGDPTLMFTNAGMNQFKDVFLGNQKPQQKRVANAQKCLRVSGKHNDLEEVGVDTYHQTMFEMLGNWSFGDYFREEAIAWAWELLTEVYGLDKDRLYITIFEGDKQDGLNRDTQAEVFWKKWVDATRILAFDKKDNFWEMGEVGPCGPCSEIHIDLRSDAERKQKDGAALVNQDHPEVIEIWNLVFIEFLRRKDGSLEELPEKHIDTGMGLERISMALQGKKATYDTDVFAPLVQAIAGRVQKEYGKEEKTDIAMRVVSDHVRAVAFSIADGQLPSNTGAGYVIRRILRRAVRYAYSYLNCHEPIVYSLVGILVKQMGSAYPELAGQQELIERVIKEEEENFLRTLESGIKTFDAFTQPGDGVYPGDFVFELYDTYGFPADLTQLLAAEQGASVDMAGFEAALAQQKERSRAAGAIEAEDWVVLRKDDREEFVGYDYLESPVHITRHRKAKVKGKEQVQLVFNLTPFYAESGGQIGDTGKIFNDNEEIQILDTLKENDLIVHIVSGMPKGPDAAFTASVDGHRRTQTASNHTATHLLHEALRSVLGEHVTQKGSFVGPHHLRFDFAHFAKVTEEELVQVTQLVNQGIRANHGLDESRNVPKEKAEEMGAMALFGEKYGDVVRVIRFGTSVELCGGTHATNTGQLGFFMIKSESAVAAGVRRIEAVTAEGAETLVSDQLNQLEEIKQLLKSPKNVVKGVQDLQQQVVALNKQIEELSKKVAGNAKEDLKQQIEEVNGISLLAQEVQLDAKQAKDLAFQLKKDYDNLFMVLGTQANGKAQLTVALSDSLVEERGWNASDIVKDLAQHIQGGGGGQPFFATAGGGNPGGLKQALEQAQQLARG